MTESSEIGSDVAAPDDLSALESDERDETRSFSPFDDATWAEDETGPGRGRLTSAGVTEGNGAVPNVVRRLDGQEAADLGALAAVFDDLQYALRCCEHLVGVLAQQADPVLVEALWTGALVAYARCFSGRARVLTDDDLAELKLDGDVTRFHRALLRLRDHYASRHANPRETYTIGVAQKNNGTAAGVAVVGAPQPRVDDTTVRQFGRIAYGLGGLVDARMQVAQQKVHLVAQGLDAARLAALPLVDVTVHA